MHIFTLRRSQIQPLNSPIGSSLCGWKNAFLNQPLTEIDSVIEIDLQGDDRSPACGRPARERRAIPAKMPRPLVTARMEQWNDLLCFGIDPGDIRPFVTVARKTG
jgi:hypothetical protein